MLRRWSPAILFHTLICLSLTPLQAADLSSGRLKLDESADKSPVSLALIDGGKRLLTANQTSGSVSLVDVPARKVLHEMATGNKPAGVAVSRDGKTAVVTHWFGYDAAILTIEGDKL
ncbi:MAG: YncE family protein, partial [bacterium]